MAIIHRYFNDLQAIENEQIFCGKKIQSQSNILVIGTFNPDNSSCTKKNDSTWFYGRKKSNFWKYFPNALSSQSLHPLDGNLLHPENWKSFCLENNIVIIDLIKKINIEDKLTDFGDRAVECKISFDKSNTEIFDIDKAFSNITFNKVVYSLAWSDKTVSKLSSIKDIINKKLISNNCIKSSNQIKYCKTPSRNDAADSWNKAIRE